LAVFEKSIVLAQIIKHIRSLGVDEDTAADCLQEAKVAIWQAEQDGKIHADSFFATTGINAITQFLGGMSEKEKNQRYGGPLIRIPKDARAAGVESPQIDSLEALQEADSEFDIPSGESVENAVLDKIEREEQQKKMRAGFAGLSEGERKVVEIFTGRPAITSQEAAALLGMDVKTLRELRRRAIAKLKTFIRQGASV